MGETLRARTLLTLQLLLGLSACAKPGAERGPNAATRGAAAEGGTPGPGGPEAGPSAATPPGAEPGSAPSAAAAPPGSAPAVVPAAPEKHGPPLPELSVKSFGLHVGGSSADAAARAEFLRALENASWSYLDCYRAIDVPGSVGTFGADLTIGGTGGKPRVGKPRTKLRGDAFQSCMTRAFESVSFGPTPSGRAVVVSYSVKFSFSDRLSAPATSR